MMIHTCVALRPCRPPLISSSKSTLQRPPNCKFSVRNCIRDPNNSQKLVMEVKEKLEKEYYDLPIGENGRDDEDMILWYLKDRRFSVEEAIAKLTKAIKWRQEFGVADLSEDTVKSTAKTGKAYVHDFLDVNDRPVLIVVASKHLPDVHDPRDNEKLCMFLIEKALSKLPAGQEQILGIVDLRGFGTKNADLSYLTFLVIYKLVAEHCWELGHCICLPGTKNADLSYLTFLFDVFYYYYPKRLGDVLFVEAPFVFQPIWQLTKPLLKSYASMVKFCSTETVRKEYFTEETLPISFRD
ncbi:hypothetical protein ES319_D09G187800v1 [Gossypium barbadense]|uniref:CRAL-TRIO domain-containing protein n=1 Tax=Gossypium barbadense TaxID=3634 RepID=A0A5J5Q4P9_GOSBA|nr:hypothetical protein ES319_D09G187800v1 [Gossypium barbadense]KAB2013902.1 hypothetical protein ES319_D09G187800v1 [Gossypium barbadense]